MDWIVDLIGNYAFPIICTCALFQENHQQRKSHAEESKQMSSVLESHIVAITKLTDKVEELHDDMLGGE